MNILIYGTVNSVIFALIALGFTLVYGVSRVPNFAHGSIYVLVGFITWTLINDLKVPYGLAIVFSLIIASAVGLIVYRFVLIRLRGLPTSEIIASFGVSLIILEGLRMQGIAGFKGFIGPFYILPPFIDGKISIFGVFVDYQRLIIIAAGILLLIVMWESVVLVGTIIFILLIKPSGLMGKQKELEERV